MPEPTFHPSFLALPLGFCADAALSTATELGAAWGEFRVGRTGYVYVSTHDRESESELEGSHVALGVRVLVDGVWGFASDPEISPVGARRAARAAVALAKVAAPLTTRRVELGPLGTARETTWIAPCDIDPFQIPRTEISDLLLGYSDTVLRTGAEHVDSNFWSRMETKYYADTHGNRITQQRLYSHTELTGTRPDSDGYPVSLRTNSQPVGRGWEWMVAGHYDWTREIENLGPLLVQKSAAPLVQPGRYDLVIDPTQLWLTIHESIGHATELDRILGYEANYAGTTFVRREDLGTLRYGDRKLNVTADRNMEHGLATVAFDDEGVPTRNFPLITEGILVGLQADRGSAQMAGLETTGCAYAEDANYVPLQRMPNISMQADPNGRSREAIVADVEDGFLVIGDDSWSIDMQRKNFQFTAQQFWRIRNGQLDGMVRDAGYQSTTPQFWGSLAEVGGPQTWLLHGAINCGKGQPGQSAPVGHGAPVARFNQINVISTTDADNSAEVLPATVQEGVN